MEPRKLANTCLSLLAATLLASAVGSSTAQPVTQRGAMAPAAVVGGPAKPPEYKIGGTLTTPVADREAGLPRETLPGAKFVTLAEWTRMREIPRTGLYIVDSANVPNGLAEDLRTAGYRLSPDGVLRDAKDQPKALFIVSRLYQGGLTKRGALDSGFTKFARAALGMVITPAHAGNPLWFACWSHSFWLEYSNGFCRWQKLHSVGDAFGHNIHNTCSGQLPHTKITSIEVRASIGGINAGKTCKNASSCSTQAEWDIGCFWPAYGSSSLTNFASLIDKDPAHGNPRGEASVSWFH
ncbi:MAG: hypothetical protein WDM81_05565 [Rhizomicrobium sp.]